jgi:hypothetical protein
MRRWFSPASYHTAVLICFMGILSALFALNTVDLAKLTLETLKMIRQEGVMGMMFNGLWHLAGLTLQATASLLFYLGFKAIEHVLMSRWFPH